jgi:hypothetical protein
VTSDFFCVPIFFEGAFEPNNPALSVCHRTVSGYGTASNTLRASSTHTLLAGLSGSNALDAFVRMVEAGTVRPDATTLASVLPAAVEVADIATGR